MEPLPKNCLSDFAHHCHEWIDLWADNPDFVEFAHGLQKYLCSLKPGSRVTTMPSRNPDRQPWAVAVMADLMSSEEGFLEWEFSDDYSIFMRLQL